MPVTSKRTGARGLETDVLRVLREAVATGAGGELVVRSGGQMGRIFVVGGRIAWASVNEESSRLTTRLVALGLVTTDDVALLLEECRRTGANFCEQLVAWGLVERERLRAELRQHVAELLQRILALPSPEGLFVPQTRSFQGDLTFTLDELRPSTPARAATSGQARAPHPEEKSMTNVQTALDQAMRIDGAIAVALVDYESGMSLGTAGGGSFNIDVAAAGNTNVFRAKLQVAAELGLPDAIEDMLITLSTQYHLLRPLRSQGGLMLYLALDRTKANLAMARHKLTQLEGTLRLE